MIHFLGIFITGLLVFGQLLILIPAEYSNWQYKVIYISFYHIYKFNKLMYTV
jgi:hypothetical protein